MFRFTRDERLAVAVLAAAIIGIVAIRLISRQSLGSRVEVRVDAPVKTTAKRPDTLFRFDPNKVTVNELQLLGFSEKQAQAIERYRQAGAKFRTPADFGRSFVVSDSMLKRLTPYMVFENQSDAENFSRPKQVTNSQKTDLNSADSTTLCAIFGIGNVLSHRILDYRNRLGGFVSFNQLNEIYGLDSCRIDEIKKNDLNINSYCLTEYINKVLNQTIVLYEVDMERTKIDEVYVESNFKNIVFKTFFLLLNPP